MVRTSYEPLYQQNDFATFLICPIFVLRKRRRNMEESTKLLEEMRRKIAAMPPEKRKQVKARVVPEALKAADVAHNIDAIIKESDDNFKNATALNEKDLAFLALCLGFQVARQYWLTPFEERLTDKDAAEQTSGHGEEASNRIHRFYHPPIEEIISNPVPFDAMMGSKKFQANLSGQTHRYIPGHDPILGYIVGTMNILTSTVTGFNGESFHVKTGFDKLGRARDCLCARADNHKIIEYTRKRIFNEGSEGMTAFAAALVKEHIHLKSDLKTSQSLPLPFISSISPTSAKSLSDYGLDMLNVLTVGKQALWSVLINLVISLLHRMMMPVDADERIYKAKTKKIIAYSNLLATSSNILYTSLTKKWNKLDVGGSLVTIYNIVATSRFLTDLQIALRYENLEKHLNS